MAKNSYKNLTPFFTPPKYADQKQMKEKNIPRWLFECSTTKGKVQLSLTFIEKVTDTKYNPN